MKNTHKILNCISVGLWAFVLILDIISCIVGSTPTWIQVFFPVAASMLYALNDCFNEK